MGARISFRQSINKPGAAVKHKNIFSTLPVPPGDHSQKYFGPWKGNGDSLPYGKNKQALSPSVPGKNCFFPYIQWVTATIHTGSHWISGTIAKLSLYPSHLHPIPG